MMPYKQMKPCRCPTCPNLTFGTYCDVHKKLYDKTYDATNRTKENRSKYGANWRKVRARYVKEHPFCELCLKEGRYVPVEEVHHIVPIKKGGTNEFSNLMSLCQSCHQKVHIKLGDRMGWR